MFVLLLAVWKQSSSNYCKLVLLGLIFMWLTTQLRDVMKIEFIPTFVKLFLNYCNEQTSGRVIVCSRNCLFSAHTYIFPTCHYMSVHVYVYICRCTCVCLQHIPLFQLSCKNHILVLRSWRVWRCKTLSEFSRNCHVICTGMYIVPYINMWCGQSIFVTAFAHSMFIKAVIEKQIRCSYLLYIIASILS